MRFQVPVRFAAALAALLIVLVVCGSSPASAAVGDQGIAAIVNDEVISTRDVRTRVDLLIATGALENIPEVRTRAEPEVLRLLIDERLKQQEARRLGVTVTQAEVERALGDIARQARIDQSQLEGHLRQRGSSLAALVGQVETELAWLKAVGKVAGDRATISEDEVADEIERIRKAGGGFEYRFSEILIAVDDPGAERNAATLARRVVDEARGGGSFPALARAYSQSASAEAGGDLGWMKSGQIDPRIEASLARMTPGQVSEPIRTDAGFVIVAFADRRTAPTIAAGQEVVLLRQVMAALPPQPSPAAVEDAMRKVQAIRTQSKNCDEFLALGNSLGPGGARDLGKVDLQRVAPQVRDTISPLKDGETTQPIRTSEGVLAVMVCGREIAPVDPEVRQMVARRLLEQRLTAISRQHLRDLKREAMLDIRN